MKRIAWLVVIALIMLVPISGCSQKQQEEKLGKLEIKEEGITEEQVVPATSMPTLPANETQMIPPPSGTQLPPPSRDKATPPMTMGEELLPVMPSDAITPSAVIGEGIEWNKKVQTALKNAGFYNGAIDGKFGPMSKKAVEEFQKSKGLKVDGKIGPKTWGELEKYLNQVPAPVTVN